MLKVRDFLTDTENCENALINEAYTHYTRLDGTNVTKVAQPNDASIVVVIQTKQTGKRVIGSTEQHNSNPNWINNPLKSYLVGPVTAVQPYYNEKMQGKKVLASWLERALQDHLRHFYGG